MKHLEAHGFRGVWGQQGFAGVCLYGLRLTEVFGGFGLEDLDSGGCERPQTPDPNPSQSPTPRHPNTVIRV